MPYLFKIVDSLKGRTLDVPMIENADGTISFPSSFNPTPGLRQPGPVSTTPRTAVISGYDAGSIAAGSAVLGPDMALAGATFNDTYRASANISLMGMRIEGVCKTAGIVGVRFVNNTASAIDLPAGTYTVTKTS